MLIKHRCVVCGSSNAPFGYRQKTRAHRQVEPSVKWYCRSHWLDSPELIPF